MKTSKSISKGYSVGIIIQVLILFFGLVPSDAAEKVTVMTRNMYLGAEIQSLGFAASYEEFLVGAAEALTQIANNNIEERVVSLASEIVERNPHLVGLQEVYNFTIDGSNIGPPFCDYLSKLLEEINEQGASYCVAAVVENMDLTISNMPIPTYPVEPEAKSVGVELTALSPTLR